MNLLCAINKLMAALFGDDSFTPSVLNRRSVWNKRLENLKCLSGTTKQPAATRHYQVIVYTITTPELRRLFLFFTRCFFWAYCYRRDWNREFLQQTLSRHDCGRDPRTVTFYRRHWLCFAPRFLVCLDSIELALKVLIVYSTWYQQN